MDKKEYIVENYVFTSIEQGRMAEKEKKMIELLIQKTDFNHKDALKNQDQSVDAFYMIP